MTLPLTAHKEVAGRSGRCSFELVMTFTREGLALGGAILAPLRHGRDGVPEIAIDGAEDRILALLAVAYGKAAQSGVLGMIRRAARYWHRGEKHLAAIEIALTGLPPLVHKEQASARLHLGETLLAAGLGPRELIELCDLDPSPLDVLKAGYNPDQPRAPAGNPDGGQWASEGDEAPPSRADEGTGSSMAPGAQPSSAAGGATPEYEIIKKPPKDAKVVIAPDGVPIQGGDPPEPLIAPPHADYREVYAAGQAVAQRPVWEQYSPAHAAIAQGGQFDFQRDPATHKLYRAYIPAANYAVGVYMAGAGYTLSQTLLLAKAYAFGRSSNYSAQNREEWIKRGWSDAAAGRWK
jgi:hypothetical protein